MSGNNLDNELLKYSNKTSWGELGSIRYRLDRRDIELNGSFINSIIMDGSSANSSNNPATTTERTGGLIPFLRSNFNRVSFLDSSQIVYVSSSSINDTIAGSGAQKIFISGLNSNWDIITDEVEMNGQTPVATNKQFLRINKLFVSQVATNKSNNAGDIYVSSSNSNSSGVPLVDILNCIQINYGYSTVGIYSVPRFHKLYFTRGSYYTNAGEAKTLRNAQYTTYPWSSNNFNTNRITLQVGNLASSSNVAFDTEGSIPEVAGSDIEFTVQATAGGANNVNYSIFWNTLVIKDPKLFG